MSASRKSSTRSSGRPTPPSLPEHLFTPEYPALDDGQIVGGMEDLRTRRGKRKCAERFSDGLRSFPTA